MNHVRPGRKAKFARRAEAVTRQRERTDRTAEQQIALLKDRPGNSTREVGRLSC